LPYRLIALDLDGTSVETGRMPTARVRAAVRAAQERGAQVVIATGRAFASAARYAAALGLSTPLICFQGALIKEQVGAQATLLAEPVPLDPLAELVRLAEEWDLELSLQSEAAVYMADIRHPRHFYDLWFGLPICRVSRLDDVLRADERRELPLIKALCVGDPDAMIEWCPGCKRASGDDWPSCAPIRGLWRRSRRRFPRGGPWHSWRTGWACRAQRPWR